MIVAVGDIHAYGTKLANLMLKLEERVDFDETTFVFLGDYVDGGPDAKEVINALMHYEQLYPHWQFLFGNHEDLMLAGIGYDRSRAGLDDDFYLWYNQGGRATAKSYIPRVSVDYMTPAHVRQELPRHHLEWLRTRPLTYETDAFIFVHAGLRPGATVEETSNAHKLWIREPFLYSNYDWGKIVVAGHTFHREPLVHKNKMVIDTMHHGGGCLTAVILNEPQPDEPLVYEFVQSFYT